MKPHISIITLGVKNVKKSTEFYKKLGFPIEADTNITFIKMPNIWMSLFELSSLLKDANIDFKRNISPTFTLAHNVASETQVNKIIEEAKSIGANITDEPHKRSWGGYSGYFQDPDGYLWEIAYNPFSPKIAVSKDK